MCTKWLILFTVILHNFITFFAANVLFKEIIQIHIFNFDALFKQARKMLVWEQSILLIFVIGSICIQYLSNICHNERDLIDFHTVLYDDRVSGRNFASITMAAHTFNSTYNNI